MNNNLKAEMARKGITRAQLAKAINRTYGTFLMKLNGESTFNIEEAKIIKKNFFPERTIDYLFDDDFSEGEEAA